MIGLTGNCVAIPILLSKRLSSIFNRILICLAAFDNIFIICSLLEAIRKNFGPIHEMIHSYAFAYFLYQLQSVAIVSSIFTTIVLALERRLAVVKPIEYHNAVQVNIAETKDFKSFSEIISKKLESFKAFILKWKCFLFWKKAFQCVIFFSHLMQIHFFKKFPYFFT